ncbi:hypothetical protein EYF80_044406 [Liparis tanakae]|uniref:Uncharacterized protein n=1 Tax=Liparis tanakae TaxID=230148 RepID=A0A4Z2FWW3_9TELE|nr:hypothetical protein EYF80_044406 [Liparis tanakae]
MLQSDDTQQQLIQSLWPESTWTFLPEERHTVHHQNRHTFRRSTGNGRSIQQYKILSVLSLEVDMSVRVPFWGNTRSLTTPSWPWRSNTASPGTQHKEFLLLQFEHSDSDIVFTGGDGPLTR